MARTTPSPTIDLTPLTQALETLRISPGDTANERAFARQAGLPPKHLRALCHEHYHLSPNTLIDRARVAAASAALAAGANTGEAGADAGYASEGAYERSFRQYQGLSPREYRALASRDGREDTFVLTLPAGFATAPVQHLMNRDPSAASERVLEASARAFVLERGLRAGNSNARPCVLRLTLRARHGEVRITPRHGRRGCTAAERLSAQQLVRRLLGFESHLPTLRARARQPENAWFTPLLARHPGLRVPLMASEYEALIWAILGQQVNLAFAGQLRAELIRLAQATPADPTDQLLPHPEPSQVARLDPATLQQRRFSRSKARWIVDLSGAIAEGRLALRSLGHGPAGQAYDTLLAHKGIGDWTAQYVMLRGMGYNDCVPAADAGLMRNLQGATGAAQRPKAPDVARWLAPLAPARSVACQHVWAWQGNE